MRVHWGPRRKKSLHRIVPSRLVDLVCTFIHYYCLPRRGSEMEFLEGSVYQGLRIRSIDVHEQDESTTIHIQRQNMSRTVNSERNLPEPAPAHVSQKKNIRKRPNSHALHVTLAISKDCPELNFAHVLPSKRMHLTKEDDCHLAACHLHRPMRANGPIRHTVVSKVQTCASLIRCKAFRRPPPASAELRAMGHGPACTVLLRQFYVRHRRIN